MSEQQAKPLTELPSAKALMSRFARYLENDGLRGVRNWALPNSAEETDEQRILAHVQAQDEDAFVRMAIDVIQRKSDQFAE